MNIVSDIREAIEKVRSLGEEPAYARMNPMIARLRKVRGNSRHRKAARFYNRKRIKFLRAATGLDIFIA